MVRNLLIYFVIGTVFLSVGVGYRGGRAAEPSPIASSSGENSTPLVVFPSPALMLPRLSRPLRGTLPLDAVQSRLVQSREAAVWYPHAGEVMKSSDGSDVKWELLSDSEAKQALPENAVGGYLHVVLELPADRIAILQGSGVGMLYINGEPHAGDLYQKGLSPVPVQLRKGTNHFTMLVVDQQPRIQLGPCTSPFSLSGNHVASDLVPGVEEDFTWAGAGVSNATAEPLVGVSLRVTRTGFSPLTCPVTSIPPLSVLRVAYKIPGGAPPDGQPVAVRVELLASDGATVQQTVEYQMHTADLNDPREPYRQTFLSQIDGSVQYYAVKQAVREPGAPLPAMILTLHGASVEAASHVTHIGGKSWAHLVSPTNRGVYGFDWEDYGRKDALEALEDAQRRLPTDRTRVYLSGHSMGGHGTWHLGCLFPDRFAAIGPSAGWVSYWSYRGHPPFPDDSPLHGILRRPMLASDTEKLLPNLTDRAVYILHGSVDGNVPPEQSRGIADLLKGTHRDWTYREEPGSHFWNSKESDSSSACVDWPEMMQCFARHVIPPDAAVRSIDFVTPNPRTTSRLHWLTIHTQQHHGEMSRVRGACWPIKGEFELDSENVSVLRLDTRHLRGEHVASVRLDGKNVTLVAGGHESGVWFERVGDEWRGIDAPPATEKGPHRYGPVKEELDRRFVVVYGTQGNAEENACMLAKARYDAETFLSRGNCSAEIMSDREFRPSDYVDRSVMLIGNADTNSAWTVLLPNSPVRVRRNEICVGDKVFPGENLAALFVQPRADSEVASVVAMAGTGPVGFQLTYRWSLFVPFVRYPDCIVSQATAANQQDPQMLAAGFFGRDWSVDQGEFVYAE